MRSCASRLRSSSRPRGFPPGNLRAFALAACVAVCALLGGCVLHPPLVRANLAQSAPAHVELDATPFFPQRKYQCGPAALATVLGASGVPVTAEALTPLVYIPGRHGSLQIEMEAVPRKFGRLAYPLDPNLDAILSELDAGRPVLVLHNYGIPHFPRWHYAVVIGYDAETDTLVLRSGVTRRQTLSAANFMRAWDNGGRWALVLLRPGELPASADADRYLQAAAGFERVAKPEDARLAFDAAVRRWPEQPLAWIGRGTAEYRAGALSAAARDYEVALHLDGTNVGARNNLAMTLLELGCPEKARKQLEHVDEGTLRSPLREAVLDTRRRLAEATATRPPRHAEACEQAP